MTTEQHRLYIGTKGWHHPNWQDGFYPDDLPEEWALTYYSNEIPVVYVTQEMGWPELASTLLEESNEKFRFLLGLQDTENIIDTALLRTVDLLAERLLGVVLQVDRGQLTTAQLQAMFDQLKGFRIAVDFGPQPVTAEWQACLDQNRVNPCYYAENSLPITCVGNLVVCFMLQEYNPRGLRDIIEPCLKLEQPEREMALILTSATPSLDVLRNANVISNLL